jgi:uncharacterized membrane protein
MIRPNFELPKAFVEELRRAEAAASQLSPTSSSAMVDLAHGKTTAPGTPKMDESENEELNEANTIKETSPTLTREGSLALISLHPLSTRLNTDDAVNAPTLTDSMRNMSLSITSSRPSTRTTSGTSSIANPPAPSWKKRAGKQKSKAKNRNTKGTTKKEEEKLAKVSMDEPSEEKKQEIRTAVKAARHKYLLEHMPDHPDVRELWRLLQEEEDERETEAEKAAQTKLENGN